MAKDRARRVPAPVWVGLGVAAAGGAGFAIYRATRPAGALAPSQSSGGTGPTTQPSGASFQVTGLQIRPLAQQVGKPVQLTGTITPSLTGTGAVLTVTDQTGRTLGTMTSGSHLALSLTEGTPGLYTFAWTISQGGQVLVSSPTPATLHALWVDPTATNALALFGGKVALLQSYLAAYPYQSGVQSPANALSYAIQNTLAGTEYGYRVAGLTHQIANGVVTNTVLTPPAGSHITYTTLGPDPIATGYVLIGKSVNGDLWQVYPAKASGSSGGSGSSGASALAAAKAQYQSLVQQEAALKQQVASQQSAIASLEAAVSQLTSQLQAVQG